jgi:hypothetical protein
MLVAGPLLLKIQTFENIIMGFSTRKEASNELRRGKLPQVDLLLLHYL